METTGGITILIDTVTIIVDLRDLMKKNKKCVRKSTRIKDEGEVRLGI